MNSSTLDGMIFFSALISVMAGWQSTVRWYACALIATLVAVPLGAFFTYNAFAGMQFPERGIEWSGAVISAAGWALVLGAVAGGARSIWKARRKNRADG